jgi:hypothetical protein
MSQGARAEPNATLAPARLIEVEPGTCYAGAWANVAVTLWVSRGTLPAAERVARVSEELRAQFPNGVSSIHLIREGAALPTSEGRERLIKLMNVGAEQLACVGIVVGGSGFWASAIRSLVTGMRAVSSRAYQLKLAGSIGEIVDWLPALHNKRTGSAITAAELQRALEAASAWEATARS